jgi:peptidoglycan-associated lipoprotein
MKKLLASAALIALLAACSSSPKLEEAPVEERPPATPGGTGAGTGTVKPQGLTEEEMRRRNPLTDPSNILSKRSVFFEFDSDRITDEYKPLVEAHAKYLRENKQARMLIQGNADDRGSREYNLGLGQRRSDALKRALVLLGAMEAQIEAVSLGEEKPKCTEATETCWAQNRRDDMLYQGEF